MYTEYNDQFQVFAAIALFMLFIDFIIMDRKNRKLAKIKCLNSEFERLISIRCSGKLYIR